MNGALVLRNQFFDQCTNKRPSRVTEQILRLLVRLADNSRSSIDDEHGREHSVQEGAKSSLSGAKSVLQPATKSTLIED